MADDNKQTDSSQVKKAIELLILSLGLDPQKVSKAKKLILALKSM